MGFLIRGKNARAIPLAADTIAPGPAGNPPHPVLWNSYDFGITGSSR